MLFYANQATPCTSATFNHHHQQPSFVAFHSLLLLLRLFFSSSLSLVKRLLGSGCHSLHSTTDGADPLSLSFFLVYFACLPLLILGTTCLLLLVLVYSLSLSLFSGFASFATCHPPFVATCSSQPFAALVRLIYFSLSFSSFALFCLILLFIVIHSLLLSVSRLHHLPPVCVTFDPIRPDPRHFFSLLSIHFAMCLLPFLPFGLVRRLFLRSLSLSSAQVLYLLSRNLLPSI